MLGNSIIDILRICQNLILHLPAELVITDNIQNLILPVLAADSTLTNSSRHLTLTIEDLSIRIATAASCGFMFGLERHYNKADDMPYLVPFFILLCILTTLFVMLSLSFTNDQSPSRTITQVFDTGIVLSAIFVIKGAFKLSGLVTAVITLYAMVTVAFIGVDRDYIPFCLSLTIIAVLIGFFTSVTRHLPSRSNAQESTSKNSSESPIFSVNIIVNLFIKFLK